MKAGETVTITARRVLAEPSQRVRATVTRQFPDPMAVVRDDVSTQPVVTWPLRLGVSHRLELRSTNQTQNCFALGLPEAFRVDIGVVPTVSLSAARNAPRDYSFTGRVVPARGQKLTLWRVEDSGRRVLTSTSVVGQDGTYRFDRRFTGSGRFGFQVDVAATPSNLIGRSAVRPTVIH